MTHSRPLLLLAECGDVRHATDANSVAVALPGTEVVALCGADAELVTPVVVATRPAHNVDCRDCAWLVR